MPFSVLSVPAIGLAMTVLSGLPPHPQEQEQEQEQERPQGAPTEAADDASDEEAQETPKEPPPPDGLLPLAEVARFSYTPSERPSVLVEETTLIVVTSSGVVDAYDTTTAELRFRLGLSGERLLPPVRAPGEPLVIALVSETGKLFRIDGLRGDILSEHELGIRPALPPLYPERPDDLLVLGTEEGEVVTFDAAGAERWRAQLGERPMALERSDSTLFVSGGTQSLFALDMATGRVRFRFRGRGAFHAPVALDAKGEKLYVGDDGGDFYCLRADDGKIEFRWATGGAIRDRALVEGDRVYIATYGNTLYAYRSGNGHEQWRLNLPGRPRGAVRRVHQRLLVTMLDGALVEVQPDRGRRTGIGQAPGEPLSPPSLYVAPRLDVAAGTVSGPASSKPVRATASESGGDPPLDPPGSDDALLWYERSRIAVSLRSGEVVLLAHERPEPVLPEADADSDASEGESPPRKPPPSPPPPR